VEKADLYRERRSHDGVDPPELWADVHLLDDALQVAQQAHADIFDSTTAGCGSEILFTTISRGAIDWTDYMYLYDNIQSSMSQLRSMVHGVTARARQWIFKAVVLWYMESEVLI
jgi:hypothetical protein